MSNSDVEIIFLGEIPCGFPSPSSETVESNLNLHDYVVKKPSATFFMQAAGDSMIGAGIYPKDILVIDRSISPRSGHIVAASVDGKITLKRLSYHFGKAILIPENEKYKPISIQEDQDFKIFGVLTYNLHKHI